METNATCACGCGKPIKPISASGVPRYHAKGHGKTGNVLALCGTCGIEFKVGLWRLEKFGRVFCSQQCSGLAQRRPYEFTCEFCGKKFSTKRSRKTGNRFFCGHDCFSKAHEAETDTKVDVCCSQCGQSFRVYPSKLKANQHFYCNRDCRALHIAGENNPSYRSGSGRRVPYGPNWRRQRRAARERDGNQCQNCGLQTRKPRRLHVHHIRPFYLFSGDFEQANDLMNLITLCSPCHKKAEAGAVIVQARLL